MLKYIFKSQKWTVNYLFNSKGSGGIHLHTKEKHWLLDELAPHLCDQFHILSLSFYLGLWISQHSIFLFCECCTLYLAA